MPAQQRKIFLVLGLMLPVVILFYILSRSRSPVEIKQYIQQQIMDKLVFTVQAKDLIETKPLPPDVMEQPEAGEIPHWMDAAAHDKLVAGLQINDSEMKRLKQLCEDEGTINNDVDKSQLCPCYAANFTGHVQINTQPPSWKDMNDYFPTQGIKLGGHYQPEGCQPRQRIAIIIMYRDRQQHLQILLNHLHTHLPKHRLEYRIFVVEQAYPNIFNRGALINLGFVEASKHYKFDCLMPHDVDLLLQDDRNMYGCYKMPRHMSGHNDKHAYKTPPKNHFGGVTAIREDIFRSVNGYPNSYWGWGGEDDDMSARLQARGNTIFRHPLNVEHFTLLKHPRHKLNPYNTFKSQHVRPSNDQLIIAGSFKKSQSSDGLNNFKYELHDVQKRPLYTWIYAEPMSAMSNFTSKEGSCGELSQPQAVKMPLMPCADLCNGNANCKYFVIHYDKSWQPYCFISTKSTDKCTFIKKANAFVYTKDRHVSV